MLLSCKENLGLTDIENKDPNSLTINEAKLWFEKNITNKSSARTSDKNDKKPKWDKYYETDLSIGKGMVIELDFVNPKFPKKVNENNIGSEKSINQAFILSENELSKLFMYKNKKGQMQTEIITSIPDEEYFFRKKGVIENKDYSGTILVRDWEGKYLRGYGYKNGKRFANYSSTDKSSRKAIFVCGKIDWFSQSCYTPTNDCTVSYMYTETQYCSECCSSEDNDNNNVPIYSDYNNSSNINGQAGFTGSSLTSAQKQALVNSLMNSLNAIGPIPQCNSERIYYLNNPLMAGIMLYYTTEAKNYADVYFCSGLDNTNKNAFIHTMWNALMARNFSYDFAIFHSTLHECSGSSATPMQNNMDLFNNEVGASYGHNYSFLSENSLGVHVSNIIKSGQGKRIVNGNLVPTNSDGECTNN